MYIPCVILALIILANIYLGARKAAAGEPAPMLYGFSPLVVLSGSMEPALYPGDVVLIRRQAAEAYRVGDIATYLDGATVYTHRIAAVQDGLYTMKGDANNTTDEVITADRLLGKVVLIIPKLGYLILFIKRPAGMAVMAAAVLLAAYSGVIIQKLRKKPVGAKR
jgi:signal peptidase